MSDISLGIDWASVEPLWVTRQPTGALRFVSRDIDGRPTRILQQEWLVQSSRNDARREWCDVPLEQEEPE